MPKQFSSTEILKIIKDSNSMMEAAQRLGLTFSTFKSIAIGLGAYEPNEHHSGKKRIFKTEDILKGKHPHFQSCKLRLRLLNENIKENKCEICDTSDWRGQYITIELHHINGNRNDHRLKNLQMLCPNCHSQTDTYGSRIRDN